MINVQQITSQLARLPDQALQQYAQMHKNDPYIMALALSESNRRKQMREGAQMAAPEQPKVVDQEIANMAAPMPEDVGIAQLPMNNPGYASGGIVAFGDGGEVERYQSGGQLGSAFSTFLRSTGQASAYANGTPAQKAAIEAAFRTAVQGPFVPPAGAAPVAAPAAAAPAAAAPAGAAPAVAAPAASKIPLGRLAAGTGAAGVAAIPFGIAQGLVSAMDYTREMGMPTDPMGEFSTGAMTPEQAAFDENRRQDILRRQAAQRAEDARLQAIVEGREPPKPAAPAAALPASPDADFPSAARTRAAPNVDTTGAGGARPSRPAAPAAAAAAVPAAGLLSLDPREMLKREMETAAKQPVPQEAELKEVGKERVQAKEEYEKGLEAIHKKFDDIYKGKRERLAAKGTEIEKMKDQGIGLALLQAGAAMMSTPGGLGVALGKGVKVGTEQYASGLERLRSAQEKLSDAQDRLEEAEAQRGEMSARELLKARSDIKNTGISAREDMIKFYMERDKVNRETALKMVDNQIQVGIAQFREAEATKRTGMEIEGRMRAANAPSGQERIALALGNGNLEAGLRKVAEIQAGKFDPKKAYTEYLVAAQKTPGSDLLTYSQFIGQFAIPTSPGNNPAVAPGTVRERP